MIISREQMKTRLNAIIDSEVLDRIDEGLKYKANQSQVGSKSNKLPTPYLKQEKQINDPDIFSGNIEKFYGLAQIPIGMIGPLKVNGLYAREAYQVPLATTEGALVASYNRGSRIISMSGGANVLCISECITRAPGFIFENVLQATQFVAWVSENFGILKDIAKTTTRHGHLEDFNSMIDGRYVWIIFRFVSGDASGQNMVTIATDEICHYINEFCPIRPRKWYIDGNLSGDKKATRLSYNSGRGKNMLAEVTIKSDLVRRVLRTTPQDIVEYSQMATFAAIHSGSIGVNAHYANGLAALFISCGQDVACVAESSVGTSRAELTANGDLYVSVSLPNLVVGTVGGGTHLPTQKECLEMIGCFGQGHSKKFAEICAAVVLAGEISIVAAIAGGYFTEAHKKYGRIKKVKKEKVNDPNSLAGSSPAIGYDI